MKQVLSKLGFTSGEEKAYVALLKLGTSTTGPIAKEAQLSRSKLYEVLEKLSRKGVVSHHKKNKTSYFSAAPPERILDYIKQKELELEQERKEFEANIGLFKAFIGEHKNVQEAEVFEGLEGIKNVREDALKQMDKSDCMLYFGNPASGHDLLLGYWDDWNNRRIKKGITSQTIYNQDAKEFGKRREKQALTQVKYLPQAGPTHAWIEIYNDTVVIAMKHKTPMSIVIKNKYVAESFKTYHSILWAASDKK